MRIGQALELARKSIPDFEEELRELKLSELYHLVDDLQYANQPEAFRPAQRILRKRLSLWYEKLKEWEATHKKADFKDISRSFGFERYEAFNHTGFDVFNPQSPELNLNILPSDFFDRLIKYVDSWGK